MPHPRPESSLALLQHHHHHQHRSHHHYHHQDDSDHYSVYTSQHKGRLRRISTTNATSKDPELQAHSFFGPTWTAPNSVIDHGSGQPQNEFESAATPPLSPCSPFNSPKPSWATLPEEEEDDSFATPDLLPSLDLEDEDDTDTDEEFLCSPAPLSPASLSQHQYHHHYPSSPSRRGAFASLEDDDQEISSFFSPPSPAPSLLSLQDDDDDHHMVGLEHTKSPSPSLLSLPELDSNFDVAPSPPDVNAAQEPDLDDLDLSIDDFLPTGSLLLLDNPTPPAEHEHTHSSLTFSPEEIAASPDPPTLIALLDIRKRAQNAERSAKEVEVSLASTSTSAATSSRPTQHLQRTEVRRTRKAEKERAKEVGALVRLKMRQFASAPTASSTPTTEESPITSISKLIDTSPTETSPRITPASSNKTSIGTLDQLVARMVFRRSQCHQSGGSKEKEKCKGNHWEPPPTSPPLSFSSSGLGGGRDCKKSSSVKRHSPLRVSLLSNSDGSRCIRVGVGRSSTGGSEKSEDDEDEDEDELLGLKGLPGL